VGGRGLNIGSRYRLKAALVYWLSLADVRKRGGRPSSFQRYQTKRDQRASGNTEGLASEPLASEIGLIVTTMFPIHTKFENFIWKQF